MKAVLRFFIILAAFLVPFTFLATDLKERFPIMVGITLAVTLGYWLSYAILEKKRKQQESQDNK
jgi:uncharacterized PurR-regulated membrane protein YhhQ (DUF165 family)